jgi:hypothetical protein
MKRIFGMESLTPRQHQDLDQILRKRKKHSQIMVNNNQCYLIFMIFLKKSVILQKSEKCCDAGHIMFFFRV